MTKVTLNDVDPAGSNTANATAINANSATIETAFDNTLSRDGTAPNTMQATIDMNGNRIVNLPEPITSQEPARVADLAAVVNGGTLTLNSIPSGGTANQVLKKNSSTNYDVSWVTPTTVSGTVVTNVADVTALKAVDTTVYQWANMLADGKEGSFKWTTGNFTTHHATDTNNGVYVKANAIASSSGSWVRVFDFQHYNSRWFGTVNDHTTDNSTIINTIINTANLQNTNSSAGKQSSVYINIEGGVRFASSSLSFLPAANWCFMYICYFANSDTSKGVSSGGGGTNEYHMMSVNSGYPGDASGGMVAESRFDSPLHPAMMMNIAKQVTSADNHFGTGQVRIPTSTSPARASYNLSDENVLRWRAVYENYAGYTNNSAVALQPFFATVALANVGSTGWPTTPSAGTIVTGVTSGAKGYKATVQSNPTVVLDLVWLSGTFIAGEKVTDGVTQSTNSITGGGVDFQNGTYPSLYFGMNSPVLTYGVFPNHASTAATVGGRMTLAPSNSSVATTLKETVTNPSLLFTSTSGAVPAAGRQIVLNSANRLVTVSGVTNGTGSTATGLVGGISAFSSFNNAAGVSSNSFNIASVTRTGVGTYTVAFTNALANANYNIMFGAQNKADFPTWDLKTTSGFSVFNFNGSAAAADLAGLIDLTVIGGL